MNQCIMCNKDTDSEIVIYNETVCKDCRMKMLQDDLDEVNKNIKHFSTKRKLILKEMELLA